MQRPLSCAPVRLDRLRSTRPTTENGSSRCLRRRTARPAFCPVARSDSDGGRTVALTRGGGTSRRPRMPVSRGEPYEADVDARSTASQPSTATVLVELCRLHPHLQRRTFGTTFLPRREGQGHVLVRTVPAQRVSLIKAGRGTPVRWLPRPTTCMLAHYGVESRLFGPRAIRRSQLRRRDTGHTRPHGRSRITGVDRNAAADHRGRARVGRERPQKTKGQVRCSSPARAMNCTGTTAASLTYRGVISMVMGIMTGCHRAEQGGGFAHYVGHGEDAAANFAAIGRRLAGATRLGQRRPRQHELAPRYLLLRTPTNGVTTKHRVMDEVLWAPLRRQGALCRPRPIIRPT